MPTASCVFAFALGLSACVQDKTVVQLRDPREVGVSLRVEGRSIPVIAPGSDHRVMDPIPPETLEESGKRYDRVHVSRSANGTIELYGFGRRGPNFSANPMVLSREIWWPATVPLGTGDALRVPFEYRDRRRTVPLEVVTPWSNVISVKSTQRFERPVGAGFLTFGAIFGAMGAATLDVESKNDASRVFSATFIGIGSLLALAGLVVLLTPSTESEWRSETR